MSDSQHIYENGRSFQNGRYVIERFLAEGGMQEVYILRDSFLEVNRVLKVPKGKSSEKRFEASAKLSARVNHPNATRLVDFFEEMGRQHLIEEFVEGINLGEFMKRIPVRDPHIAAFFLHHLSRGLLAVQRPNIVHRDLKPANIMVESGLAMRGVKITDFGVASMAGDEMDIAILGGSSSISSSKTAIGAIPYMAPEVIDEPKKRKLESDIWSIGAIAFEILTGVLPFGQGLQAIVKIAAAKAPALPAWMVENGRFGGLVNEIYGIILRCLAQDPSNRPSAQFLVEMCGRICYVPPTERQEGVVTAIRGNAYGFIESASNGFFFHMESIFGPKPNVGDKVWYRPWQGNPRPRAHPVLTLPV